MRNAVELIGEATQGPFKAEYRDQALALLAEVPASHPLREPLVALAEGIDTAPNPNPPWYRRFADGVAARYQRWSEQPWFHGAVIGVFAFWVVASILAIVGLLFSVGFAGDAARVGFEEDSVGHLNFVNWATLVSTAVSTAFVVLGLTRLVRGEPADRLPLADPGPAGLDLRHPRLRLRRVPVRRRLRDRRRRPAADLGAADG